MPADKCEPRDSLLPLFELFRCTAWPREAGASPTDVLSHLFSCATRPCEAPASLTELHSSADTRPSHTHTHVGTLQAAELRQGESSLEDPSLSPRPVRFSDGAVAVCDGAVTVCWA